MPNNYTLNYNLSQWEAEDKVLRTDFNADNAKIDAALAAVTGKVEDLSRRKAEQSALDAEIKNRTAAEAAVNAALSRCGNCRIETFAYTGDGTSNASGYSTKSITFSGSPVLFLVSGRYTLILGRGNGNQANCIYSEVGNSYINTAWSGNTVTINGDERAVPNQNGSSYFVVAFYAQDAK